MKKETEKEKKTNALLHAVGAVGFLAAQGWDLFEEISVGGEKIWTKNNEYHERNPKNDHAMRRKQQGRRET